MRPKERYKFVYVFRGQQVVKDREYSSDEEEFDTQPRLLWPEAHGVDDEDEDRSASDVDADAGPPGPIALGPSVNSPFLDEKAGLGLPESNLDILYPCTPTRPRQRHSLETMDEDDEEVGIHGNKHGERGDNEGYSSDEGDKNNDNIYTNNDRVPATPRHEYTPASAASTPDYQDLYIAPRSKSPVNPFTYVPSPGEEERLEHERQRQRVTSSKNLGLVLRGQKLAMSPTSLEIPSPTTTFGRKILWPSNPERGFGNTSPSAYEVPSPTTTLNHTELWPDLSGKFWAPSQPSYPPPERVSKAPTASKPVEASRPITRQIGAEESQVLYAQLMSAFGGKSAAPSANAAPATDAPACQQSKPTKVGGGGGSSAYGSEDCQSPLVRVCAFIPAKRKSAPSVCSKIGDEDEAVDEEGDAGQMCDALDGHCDTHKPAIGMYYLEEGERGQGFMDRVNKMRVLPSLDWNWHLVDVVQVA
ncbi:hypothetical protein BG011_007631 [Mortierella polycephala]|uniref:Uncharacterized protein n=1 Tax=Mortierella polycephala TaxID=41804 RepID=A0A9P6PPQ3_9FUNG|nr:hypothetical protein BG011_007631 [Mortierella polycephala]